MCDLWAICSFWFGRKSVCLQSPSSQTRHRRYCTRLGLTARSVLCSSRSLARLNRVGKLKKKNSGINALLCMGSQRAMKWAPMEKSLVHAQSLGGSICSEGRWPSNSTKQHWPQFYSLNVLFLHLLNEGDRSPPPRELWQWDETMHLGVGHKTRVLYTEDCWSIPLVLTEPFLHAQQRVGLGEIKDEWDSEDLKPSRLQSSTGIIHEVGWVNKFLSMCHG